MIGPKSIEKLFRRMCVIGDRTFVKYPMLYDEVGGVTVEAFVGGVIWELDDRSQEIIRLRFGMGGEDKPMTLERVGERIGVTRERVRQLEYQALKRFRVDSFERYLYKPTEHETFMASCREELAKRLEGKGYSKRVRVNIARVMKDEYVEMAIRQSGYIGGVLALSCGRRTSKCLNCDNLTVPGWDFCSKECRSKYRRITLVCDNCGKEFERLASSVLRSLGDRENGMEGNKWTFCSRKCMGAWMTGMPMKDRTFRDRSKVKVSDHP